MKILRIFYNKVANQIVWHHEIISPEGKPAISPTTIEQDIAEIPSKCPDGATSLALGGVPGDYACIELLNTASVEQYHNALNVSIVNGELVMTGEKPPPEPVIPEPPLSTHISILQAVNPTKTRPAKVKRTWQGIDYFYDCLVTQTVKDEYVAGKIKIGDYVLVHFDDIGEQVVTGKVFKSW